LNLCKQLSELLGGSIKVQSTLGAGSIFSVQIPLAQDVSSQPLKSPELAGKRIALLSSAVEWRNEISELLSSWNVTVVTGAEPRALDPAFVRSADALLFFGMQRTWDEDEEQKLVAHAKRVIRAYMDGPLQPEQRDGALFISCYSSAALSMAIGSETGHIDSFVRASPLSTELTAASDKRGRVLLVDDNAVNRELIAQQLEALGMASDAAEDGEIALRMWREDTYVAVLTDINMPNMDGYQLAQCLRDRGVTVPILAITARALPSEKVRSKEVGMTDLLLKPISLEQLDAALSRSLAKLSVANANADADEKSRSRSKFPHKIRGIFVESGTRDLQNILLAWRDRESPAVLQRLHSLKGALLMLGESSVADSCAAVEKAVEMSGLDAAQAELAQLEAALRDLLADYARPETP
jgi:two-component system capsular synthesis sensor histidine kinase RcsC